MAHGGGRLDSNAMHEKAGVKILRFARRATECPGSQPLDNF